MKRHLITTLGLAAALTLTACGTEAGSEGSAVAEDAATSAATPQASTPSDPDPAPSQDASASEEHNDADVTFAQMMIPHHRQAVEMSELMLAKDGVPAEVADLATRISAAQAPEIETMTGWLEAWGEPTEAEGGMDGHDMGSHSEGGSEEGQGSMEDMQGMMSDDRLAELESAEGTEASRLFLGAMTEHHEGAVAMAQDELDAGQNSGALDLAGSIVESQQAEIDEMEQLLAGL